MLKELRMSLRDLLGDDYVDAVIDAEIFFGRRERGELERIAAEKVDFFPAEFASRMDSLLDFVGKPVARGLERTTAGSPTRAFAKATNLAFCPLACCGPYRIGEDGKLYLAAKSEHYHAPLGHGFPGYRLLENARKIGVSNATHNSYRGYITRKLENELVKTANGASDADLPGILASREPRVLNRVINLETGSLAVEAGIKMMLAKFKRLEPSFPEPEFADRVPVFLVVADNQGGKQANYHGTTIVAQTMRGLWPDLYREWEDCKSYRVEAVRINDIADFREKLDRFDKPPHKVAGFLHEIVLMNYSAILLRRDYLRAAYDLCHAAGVPVMVDEIQSCMWFDGMFLYRKFGLDPDFVSVGKGFPGGEYTASKILATAEYDNLSQFGALVTNGQEELASMAYLVTMAYVGHNGEHVEAMGERYQAGLEQLGRDFPSMLSGVDGLHLLSGLNFHGTENAVRFAKLMNADCIDVSAQTYKADCPPAALTKPPVVSNERILDFILAAMRRNLEKMAREGA